MNRHARAVFPIAILPLCQLVACGGEQAADKQVANGRVAVVEGEVRFAGTGKPVAGATLNVFQREDSGSKVVTDGAGRFRWPVPGREVVGPGPEGTRGPDCAVMVQDAAGWSWEVVEPAVDVPSRPEPTNARAKVDCLGSLRKPAASRWMMAGRGPRLIVECPAAGDVEIRLLGPDGTILSKRPVRVLPAESPGEFRGDGNVEFRGRTDANGVVHLRWFEGTHRLRILVPGVGFGSTGAFQVRAGQTLRVVLSPMAPFAQVEGTLDPKLARPGMVVQRLTDSGKPSAWMRSGSVVDDRGRFVLRDVVPGNFLLAAVDPGPSGAPRVESLRVRAEPGQHIKGLTIPPPRTPHDLVWVEGTARDSAGRGVAGATVVVRTPITAIQGFGRTYELLREARTDPWGRYQISGPLPDAMTIAYLVVLVHAEGHPPAVAYAQAPSPGTAVRGPLDVTLADEAASSSLHVRVLRNGKPFPGANVALRPDEVIDLGPWVSRVGASMGASTAVVTLFEPHATTGADGVAHFANLFPGTYEVIAAGAVSATAPGSMSGRVLAYSQQHRTAGPDALSLSKRLGHESFMSDGIGVAPGRDVVTVLALQPQPDPVSLQVLRPDGRPVASQDVSLSLGRPNPGGSFSLALDARGLGSHQFETPGLWTVRFHDVESNSVPIDEEQDDQAEALLPISPGLRLPDPIRVQGVHRERGASRVEPRPVDKSTRGAMTKGGGATYPGMRRLPTSTAAPRGDGDTVAAAPRGDGDTVWLADGKTPAFGARGVLLAPDSIQPVASAVSDGAGRLTWRARPNSGPTRRRDGVEPEKTRAILWLPGLCGAVVLEIKGETPIRAVLPAPIEVSGTVTLGGRPSPGVDARLQIIAGRQGDADLDPVLSVSRAADANGRFRLRGLTPGRYRVQAARDGIWLSSSVTLTVEAGNPTAELALDIPEPGAAITVELVDRAGHPVPGRPLTLARPDGPLAALWPTSFRTDRAGLLTLRGLETGNHSIEIDGESTPRRFEVPVARNEAPTTEVVRFVCDDVP